MTDTLTIRLEKRDRETLEEAARVRALGVSALVRDLAEAEALRLRRAAIRAQGESIVSYLANHPDAEAELESYGIPLGDIS